MSDVSWGETESWIEARGGREKIRQPRATLDDVLDRLADLESELNYADEKHPKKNELIDVLSAARKILLGDPKGLDPLDLRSITDLVDSLPIIEEA